jgi:hypothetical protein
VKTIILINLLLISFLASAGEGASDGGPRAHISNNNSALNINGQTVSIRDIQSVETVDRTIILKKDIQSIFSLKDQRLVLNKEILNIEIQNGEMLNIQ